MYTLSLFVIIGITVLEYKSLAHIVYEFKNALILLISNKDNATLKE